MLNDSNEKEYQMKHVKLNKDETLLLNFEAEAQTPLGIKMVNVNSAFTYESVIKALSTKPKTYNISPIAVKNRTLLAYFKTYKSGKWSTGAKMSKATVTSKIAAFLENFNIGDISKANFKILQSLSFTGKQQIYINNFINKVILNAEFGGDSEV